MKLRLYHHPDGARIAYREVGTGPPLGLLHSAGLSHREWEPLVDQLADRFRLVLPDLPLHGDSEDRPRHPYSPDWLADVVAGFCRATLGPRPLVGGHAEGAELLVRAVGAGHLTPGRLVLMSNRLHGPPAHPALLRSWKAVTVLRRVPRPGPRAVATARRRCSGPRWASRLSVRDNPAARDLVRHAFADVAGNGNRARSWGKARPPLAHRAVARNPDARWPRSRPRCCCCGRARIATIRWRWPRRRWSACPPASSACCRAPAS